ncbi:hypothetical protein FPV67DRAFT_32314 [Lyophyllum atratum]|nr:hypothetical protein FPV67DRAFT_32314 [Lyophyllum atratum]
MILSSKLFRTLYSGPANVTSGLLAPDFTLLPQFFAAHEQRTLLAAALRKLDNAETRRARQRMKEYQRTLATSATKPDTLFLPDDYYNFQKGHYDGVIHHFREMHLNLWPEDEFAGLSTILKTSLRLVSHTPNPNAPSSSCFLWRNTSSYR